MSMKFFLFNEYVRLYDHLAYWSMVNSFFRNLLPMNPLAHLLPGTLIWFGFNGDEDKIVFRVWDNRLNHSSSFTVDVVEEFESDLVVTATDTAVVVLHEEALLIPHLSPQPPNFFDYNFTHPTAFDDTMLRRLPERRELATSPFES